MSSSARRIAMPVPAARSAAIAALLAAPLLASPLAISPAAAQTTTPSATTPASGSAKMSEAPGTAMSNRTETVEQRIANLHRDLGITPDQEKDWDAVAQAMRDNANHMQKLVDETHSQRTENTTALDDLDTYRKFAQAHADGVKNLIGPFTTLYSDMSPQQKKNADEVFNNFRRQAEVRRANQEHG